MTAVTNAPLRAGAREWAGLAVLALATLLVSIDLFVLLLALPSLSADLHASSTQQLWIMDMYGFMVGGFLLTMGTVGDRFGRRRLLLAGSALFGLASLLAAFSTSPEMLIAARALLGVAGATLTPSTLALISTMFRDPRQMGTAIGLWAGCFTLGAIIGPMVGGVLLAHFWWGSVFLVGVPAMVLLLILGPFLLPEYRAPGPQRLDLASVGLSLAGLLLTIYGIKTLAREGFDVRALVAVAVGVALVAVFLRRQARLADPLLDLGLFRSRSFRAIAVSLFVNSLVGGTVMMLMSQHLQSVGGLTPLRAGLGMVPGMVTSTIGFLVAPALARTVRPALLMGGGLVVALLGVATFMQVSATSGETAMIVGFAVWCIGSAPLVALGTSLIVGAAPPEKAGSASSVAQVSNELGSAVGIATLGSLGTLIYRSHVEDLGSRGVPADAVRTAGETVAAAVQAAGRLAGAPGETLLLGAREAFSDSLRVVTGVGGVLMFLVMVLVFVSLRAVPPLGAPAQSPPEEPAEEVPASVPQH